MQEVAKYVTSQEIIAKEVTAFMTNIGSVRVGSTGVRRQHHQQQSTPMHGSRRPARAPHKHAAG